jgi:hypothetical protein
MSFNFPNSPLQGQLYTPVGGYQYVFLDGKWRVVEAPQDVGTAQSRNRIVNGAMQVSQENPAANGSTAGYAVSDQWFASANLTGATVFGQRISPSFGTGYRIRQYVTVAQASVGASNHAHMYSTIEGIQISDFYWGTAAAKQAVLRFDITSSLAGTFGVSIRNLPVTTSFIAPLTISAGEVGIPVTKTVIIPGPTSETFATDNTQGISIAFSLAAGSTFQTANINQWTAGNFLGPTSITNGLATIGNYLMITNVGLYLDPLATGIAPPWVMPDEAEELRACQRYYLKTSGTATWIIGGYSGAASGTWYSCSLLPAVMRTAPAVTFASPGSTNCGAMINDSTTVTHLRVAAVNTAAGAFYSQAFPILNARM